MNARYSVMRGNTFNVGSVSTSWLQLPLYPIENGNAQIASDDTHVDVEDAPAPSGPGHHRSQREARALAAVCPCEKEGGFNARRLLRVTALNPGAVQPGPA